MRLDDYANKDGKRVWLTPDELERLIGAADTPEKRIAFMLGGKAGLRRQEIVSVRSKDFANAPDGFVRIWGDFAKQDKYREAPIPDELEYIVETYTHDADPENPVLYNQNKGKGRAGTTIYRWLKSISEDIAAESDDEGWQYLDVHDLRRSWGGHLLWDCGVMPTVVMEFGGWEDWDTFASHYMGQITPEAAQRERAKIDYMGGDEDGEEIPFTPATPGSKQVYGKSD